MTRIFLHCIVSNKEQKLKVILEKKMSIIKLCLVSIDQQIVAYTVYPAVLCCQELCSKHICF